MRSRFKGCLIGLACGDALGTSIEFLPRGAFLPLTDMVGGGNFRLPVGAWTDDTSMALCLAHSLLECKGFDAHDQMDRYVRWKNSGYMSSTGVCFDIGSTIYAALSSYENEGNPFSGSTAPNTAGNGSIMRLAPIPMWFCDDPDHLPYYAAESSRTTHGALEAIEAAKLFAILVQRALMGLPKEQILFDHDFRSTAPQIEALALGHYRDKEESAIHGTGYVVESLEAALWCFNTTDSYKKAVLRAANLGDDADTTAAICGQLAGAFYGVEAIPTSWKDKLVQYGDIEQLSSRLYDERPK